MPPQDVVICPPDRVGKSLVSLAEAQKNLAIASARGVRMKTFRERIVYALEGLFVCLRTNSQDLVMIDGENVFFRAVSMVRCLARMCPKRPGKHFDIC